jgi:hypothetical protein
MLQNPLAAAPSQVAGGPPITGAKAANGQEKAVTAEEAARD